MTIHRKKPAEPEPVPPTATPFIPQLRPSEEDRLELREPYDLPVPEYPDRCWLPRRPEYVVVVDQLRGRWPDQPLSLAEALETRPTRTRDPEPDPEADLEAEP